MSEKPSLYVVEKKEVVILVVLFVLVTVLSFTMGVRYGESVGKKAAVESAHAEREAAVSEADALGGTLQGAASDGHRAEGKKEEPKAGHKDEAIEAHADGAKDHGEAKGAHASQPAASSSPEVAARSVEPRLPAKEAVEKNSDEFLLNALKETGVEPPGGKTPGGAALPRQVKRALSGTYVVQVGSHPTRNEAESQVRQLKAKKVEAEVLAPFKDKQGEWHRVVVGSFKTKREAEREASQLKSRGAILSFFVWRLP